jgi:hypothetical protein
MKHREEVRKALRQLTKKNWMETRKISAMLRIDDVFVLRDCSEVVTGSSYENSTKLACEYNGN